MTCIRKLACGIDVSKLHEQLLAKPDLWNRHDFRTQRYGTPHADISDIWVRYNALKNFDPENPTAFNEEHDSVWYEPIAHLPALIPIIYDVLRFVEGERLGGVLITKVPPGKQVAPHVDMGWHARYYDKYAVQVAADERQAFCFLHEKLVTAPGDLYTFDNSQVHWVTNDSDIDRITLILCIRVTPIRRHLCHGAQ